MTENAMSLINGALGEAAALFMSQEVRGVDIIMPTEELSRIARELMEKLEKLKDEARYGGEG